MAKQQSNTSDAPQKDATENKVRAAVDKWYADNMHNSVVSRDADVHNLIHRSKDQLVQLVLDAVRQ